MNNTRILTEAGQQYATAYDMHYAKKDLHKAFVLYENVIAEHPAAREAEFSRAQVHNIVKAVIPKEEIADSLAKLALAHFKQTRPPGSTA